MTSFVGTYDLGSDGKTILVDLMNAAENSNYVVADFVFSDPTAIDYTDPVSGLITNSQIKLTYMAATGNYGVKTIYYNRIRASDFRSPNLHRGVAQKFSDLLGQINTRYGINILPSEISDFTLPVGDLVTVPFQFLDSSIIYMGIGILSIGAVVPVIPTVPAIILKDIFFTDGYGYSAKTDYVPTRYELTVGLRIPGLTPNTQYEAQLFATYTGDYGVKTVLIADINYAYSDSTGLFFNFIPFGTEIVMADAKVGTSGTLHAQIKSLPLPYSAYGQDVYTTSNLAINFISAAPAPAPVPAPSPYGTPTPPPAPTPTPAPTVALTQTPTTMTGQP